MILTFSSDIFVQRILSGTKMHTIRTDAKKRWRKGMPIQFWRGNPRNTKAKSKPYHFANGVCVDVGAISILKDRGILLEHNESVGLMYGPTISDLLREILAVNDGFDNSDQLLGFFNEYPFEGRLIWFKVTEVI